MIPRAYGNPDRDRTVHEPKDTENTGPKTHIGNRNIESRISKGACNSSCAQVAARPNQSPSDNSRTPYLQVQNEF